jgi:hypothetical protein
MNADRTRRGLTSRAEVSPSSPWLADQSCRSTGGYRQGSDRLARLEGQLRDIGVHWQDLVDRPDGSPEPVARGVPHTFRVISDAEARILLVHDNASFRDLIRDLSVPATAPAVPSAPAFPPMDELARVAFPRPQDDRPPHERRGQRLHLGDRELTD